MDLSLSTSFASRSSLTPAPDRRPTTNASRITTLRRLFLKNNLEQPKTTVFLLLDTVPIMKKLHYRRQGGCSSVESEEQLMNGSVTWKSSGFTGRMLGLCHMTTLVPQVGLEVGSPKRHLRDVSSSKSLRKPFFYDLFPFQHHVHSGLFPPKSLREGSHYETIRLSDQEPSYATSSRIEPLFQFKNPPYSPTC